MLLLVVILFFVAYAIFIVWLALGWRRARVPGPENHDHPLVTVVVAVRNEESTLPELLMDLERQLYSNLEVIIIDDHSSDDTARLLNRAASSGSLNVRLDVATNPGEGKKAAITAGVGQARGSIVLTTDADCRLPPTWVASTVACFTPGVNLVAGGVRMAGTDFFGRLQQLEFASLIGTGAATLGWQKPTMANGANLAFRRSVFEQVEGFRGNEHVASGDDEFLLHRIHTKFPGSLVFNPRADAVVETTPQPNVRSFFHQRLRWASKWKYRRTGSVQGVAVSVLGFQMLFLLTPWLMVFDLLPGMWGASLLTGKAFVEFTFFAPIVRFLKQPLSFAAFLTWQFLYPYYVTGTAFLSTFYSYQWKGRVSH